MRSTYCFAISPVAASLLLLASPIYAATPLAASMDLKANAMVVNKPVVASVGDDAWGPLLGPLTVSASATALDDLGLPAINARGSGSANWVSANQGAVNFSNVGWTFNNATGSADVNTGTDWQYAFTADGNGDFKMHADVVGIGDVFGLWGWLVSLDGGPEGSQTGGTNNAFDPNTTWDFLANLTAGSDYTVTLKNNANLTANGPLSSEASMSGQFSWQITGVPEPSAVYLRAFRLSRRWIDRITSAVAPAVGLVEEERRKLPKREERKRPGG